MLANAIGDDGVLQGDLSLSLGGIFGRGSSSSSFVFYTFANETTRRSGDRATLLNTYTSRATRNETSIGIIEFRDGLSLLCSMQTVAAQTVGSRSWRSDGLLSRQEKKRGLRVSVKRQVERLFSFFFCGGWGGGLVKEAVCPTVQTPYLNSTTQYWFG
jgi:hypothetical protein